MSKDLTVFHLSIKSLNPKQAVSYSISYSTGVRKLYLQDGVIVDYLL